MPEAAPHSEASTNSRALAQDTGSVELSTSLSQIKPYETLRSKATTPVNYPGSSP